MLNLLVFAAEAGGEAGGIGAMITSAAPLILMLGLMYFILIAPQRKKEKKRKEEISKIKSGEEVVTYGGIIGKICNIKDDTFVIETGADKVRIKIEKTAVREILKKIEG